MSHRTHASLATLTSFLLIGLVASGLLTSARAAPPEEPVSYSFRTYIPRIARGGADGDLKITGLELTQSVQNSAGSVPLVAGRAAVARVFVVAEGVPLQDVRVSLSATRDGVPLPGSPVRSELRGVGATASRADYGSSFNLLLPQAWLSGTVEISADVDPDGLVAEPREDNNRAVVTTTFVEVPRLNLVIVPVQYTQAASGHSYAAPTRDTVSDWIMRSYPLAGVDVTLRAPLHFSDDLRTEAGWRNLLGEITSLRAADGAAPGQVYYGLVPIADPGGANRWFTGGIAGIGWVGMRASAGLDLLGTDEAGRLAAHEIGHNLGRFHAPCGVAGDARQPFPYADGSLGPEVYGLDIARGRLWSSASPDGARDMMSYCRPQWVSDFTYRALLADQQLRGAVPATSAARMGDGLLVRADLVGDTAALRPVYQVPGSALEPAPGGAYVVELLGDDGRVVAAHPVEPVSAAPPDTTDAAPAAEQAHQAIVAVLPLPGAPVAALRLVRQGVVLAEQPLAAPRLVSAGAARVTHDGDQVVVRWESSGPALVRYSADGVSWVTLGVDIADGELRVDRALLAGGGAGRFDVLPAGLGGPLSAAAPSAAAGAENLPPQAWVDGPASVALGAPALLYGRASDGEDGALADLRWELDGAPAGVGQLLPLSELPAGEHTATLVARDASGAEVRAEHRFVVVP